MLKVSKIPKLLNTSSKGEDNKKNHESEELDPDYHLSDNEKSDSSNIQGMGEAAIAAMAEEPEMKKSKSNQSIISKIDFIEEKQSITSTCIFNGTTMIWSCTNNLVL
uniref:Uncharacterized protein n=1 Tax=Romanomermis culicivorax TaxID=13658 RepID=A0A915ITL9_ROMCU